MDDEMSVNPTDMSRMIDFLRDAGLSEKQINDCIKYIATGIRTASEPVK